MEGGPIMNQEVTLSTHNTLSFLHSSPRTIEAVIDQIVNRIGRERFEMWFGGRDSVRLQESDAGLVAVSIVADNDFALSRIKGTFGYEIRSAVDMVYGSQIAIEYRLDKAGEEEIQVGGELLAGNHFQHRLQSGLDPQRVGAGHFSSSRIAASFESSAADLISRAPSDSPGKKITRGVKSFWFGNENRLAEASIQQLFEQPGFFSPFYLYGPTGCGKSELLSAIVNDYRSQLRRQRCVMVTGEQFTTQFVGSLRGGSGLPMFRRKFRELDLLVIDDIQFLLGKKATANEFQQTIESLIREGKQVVLSSDRSPLELSALSEELGAKLAGGLSCPLRYPGLEGRIKIAERICKERKMTLQNDVLELICTRLTRDIRRISGALNRLHALAISSGCKVTKELAAVELADLFAVNSAQLTSLLNIETVVCDVCGIKPSELKSKRRHKSVSTARMLAMYLSREFTSAPYSEIGDFFGGRSHSTVIAAHKKVAQWIAQDAGLALPKAKLNAREILSRLQLNLRVG
jgi:chromosomal replication initiator protein